MSLAPPGEVPAEVIRWGNATLPEGLPRLLAEAAATGVAWMADFTADWHRGPFLDAGEGLFLVRLDDQPVAMAVISADPHVPDTDTGRLRYIYVAHAMRGRGLLRVLVDACLDRAASRWRRLRLHTDNPVAARIYESYGFVAVRDEVRSTHVRGTL